MSLAQELITDDSLSIFWPLYFAMYSRMEILFKSHCGKLLGKIFPVLELIEHSPLLEVGNLSNKSRKLSYLQEQWVVIPHGDLFLGPWRTLDPAGHGKKMSSFWLPSIFYSSKIDPISFHSLPYSLAGVK